MSPTSVLLTIRTNSVLKTGAQWLEKKAKRMMIGALERVLPVPESLAADQLASIQRILIIRPNFRIGNALISTPIIESLQRHFPGASIDMLATDKTAVLFENFGLGQVHCASRHAITRPWQAVNLIRSLRRERYDLALQLNTGSLSGLLVGKTIGARHTMALPYKGRTWFDVAIAPGPGNLHSYQVPALFATALGVSCRERPVLRLSEEEVCQAQRLLASQLGRESEGALESGEGGAKNFVALFVGGHLDKRCPPAYWEALIARLEAGGKPYVVFLGPEEFRLAPRLGALMQDSRHGLLLTPRPLREFAALLSQAAILITPDSGPMHMAVALDVPTITLSRTRRSQRFLPQGALHRIITTLAPEDVMAMLQARPAALA
ncbi:MULTISPECIES: glycosyltransferase family 9 protein [Cobetia]|uniref:glycosyltransferase family 9 protein n=1 Tax=Cobetia TaxID=204286 RepID=UPI0004699E15|nr:MULTISPECIES: glycosyltransferase family 9 protein [Cobetia]